jgi:anti-anti-sigma factor
MVWRQEISEVSMTESFGHITIENTEERTTLKFNDASILGETNIKELEARVMNAIAEAPAKEIVLDFSKIRFMASSFIRLLVKIRQEVIDQGGQLSISNVHPKIFQIFKITQLDRVFKFE